MDVGTVTGIGGLILGAIGAVNSLRKTRLEDRGGAFAEIQAVVRVLKEENERLDQKLDEAEKLCNERIASMQNTIIEQAGQIATLQRHTRGTGK